MRLDAQHLPPVNCRDSILVMYYRADIERWPRLLFGLRDDLGRPYLLYNEDNRQVYRNADPLARAG